MDSSMSSMSCPYDSLQNAEVEHGKKQTSARIKVCGRWKEVYMDVQKPDTFQEVEWWSPSTETMTPCEEQKIQEYTGHFWYSRNVGRLLKGTAPQLVAEDTEGRWKATDRRALVLEVLNFAVDLGSALNKLPTPASPVQLYRGAWAAKEIRDYLKNNLNGVFKVAWFQSTSSDKEHTFRFFRPEHAPGMCKSKPGGCIGAGSHFPIHYHYSTTQAKDVNHWNAQEKEHILLPNSEFKITSMTQVQNDPLYTMNYKELANWFKQNGHPNYEQAVLNKQMDGKVFSQIYFDKIIYGVWEALFGNKTYSDTSPHKKLQDRFTLPKSSPGQQPNMNPYYYEVVLEDPN